MNSDALDRIIEDSTDGHSSVAAAASAHQPNYIEAATWQGPKSGYYFGTDDRGTGYYRDKQKLHNAAVNGNGGGPPRKKAKRSVRIAEDRNQTREIPSAEQLLQEAEAAAKGKVIELTAKGIRQAATTLSKAVEKNELQRARHADQPDQYMESEVTLYENISALKAIAADPTTLYPTILETELLSTLLQLLMHENADIVAAVVAVLLEWLDSSLVEDDEGNIISPVVAIAAAFLRDGTELLIANLGRLQKEASEGADDDVGKGTEDVLSLMENLLEMDLAVAASTELQLVPDGVSVAAKFCQETTIVSWLFQQIEADAILRDRSLEILSLLAPREDVYKALPDWSQLPLCSSTFDDEDGEKKKPAKDTDDAKTMDGIEILLQTVAAYRKKQPSDETQVESLENACMVLDSTLTYSPANVKAFLNAQGIELAIRCLKERVHAGGVALKWLDFVGTDPVHRTACEHVVNAGALKYLFPLFLGKSVPKPAPIAATSKKAKKEWVHAVENTAIRILYTLTRHLRDDSPNEAKQRLLAKFIDDEKCDRLVELCLEYDQKARTAEYKFFRSDVEENLQDEEAIQLAALDAKLAGGGDIFHRLGAIAAFCCSGSKRCHERVLSQLHLQQSGIGLIRAALEEFVSVLGDSEQKTQLQGYLEQV